ncbi:MAG: single-stranded-DNA-specific exonuclease RecJ [Alphaproteobacteria bacterium]
MGSAILGVEQSVSGLRWRSRVEDDRLALAHAQRLGVPEVIGRALAGRGIGIDDADGYLNPSLRRDLPDPMVLKDMAPAVVRLADAVERDEIVGIFGDYDVDGATSAALLVRYLDAVGARSRVYVPDRLTEGYGPSVGGLRALARAGAKAIVTVDCGASAEEPLAEARRDGLEVIVVDHHLPGPRLPEAIAVIDPNRLDEDRGFGQLAAVGVTFLLLVALNRELRRRGRFTARPEPGLLGWLDLVALGTVCDVVPLTGLNRALVSQGLKVLARRANVGLAALADVAGLADRPVPFHLGFVLGPRINAGGRLGEPDLGVRLLTTADPIEARRIGERLDRANTERKAIEVSVVAAAIDDAEARGASRNAVAFAAGEDWHAGVIGIVASRLVERYRRPAVVVGTAGGVARGSGRSIHGVDLGAAIIAARQAGLLVNGGGHAMAAGFTAETGRLAELAEFLELRLAPAVAEHTGAPSLGLDGSMTAEAATVDLLNVIERLGPFGAGNAEPRFALADCRIVRADVVGTDHVRCIAAGPRGGRLKAIAFRKAETAVGRALLERGAPPLHLAGTLRADRWQGELGVQFVIDDAARSAP